MLRIQLEHGPGPTRDDVLDRGMVPICCDAFDAAVSAGVIKVDRGHGRAYVASSGRHWVIAYCPFCAVSHGGRAYELDGEEPAATPAQKRVRK
jgi:hypothetical protein